MAYRVVWSPRAIEDLEAIAQYIAADLHRLCRSSDQKQFSAPLVSSHLFRSPGRVVPELGDENIREWSAYSYRVIYRIERGVVTIAAVIHGKRLLDID